MSRPDRNRSASRTLGVAIAVSGRSRLVAGVVVDVADKEFPEPWSGDDRREISRDTLRPGRLAAPRRAGRL